MYIWTPLKKNRYPKLSDLAKAFKLADAQDESADPRPLASCQMAAMEMSPRLRAHMRLRKIGVTSFGWSIVSKDKGDVERAEQSRLRCQRVINQLLGWHTDILYGQMAITLNRWNTLGLHGTTPSVEKRYLPCEVERNGDDPLALNLLDEADKPNRTAITSLPPQMVIADCDDSFRRGGDLRALIDPETLRHESNIEWANYNRKLKGLIQAVYTPGIGDEDRKAAIEAITSFVSNNFAATEEGVDMRFHKLVDGIGSHRSLKDYMEYIDAAGAILILGQANLTELPDGGGSRAAVQIQNLIRADIYYADIIRMERIINDQLLLSDFQLNAVGNATEAPWRFQINVSEELDPETMARIAVDLHNAGFDLDAEETYRLMGRTLPSGTPPIIKGASAGTQLPALP